MEKDTPQAGVTGYQPDDALESLDLSVKRL
jgi:hypothetical protein